jgi:hypothetical protein
VRLRHEYAQPAEASKRGPHLTLITGLAGTLPTHAAKAGAAGGKIRSALIKRSDVPVCIIRNGFDLGGHAVPL